MLITFDSSQGHVKIQSRWFAPTCSAAAQCAFPCQRCGWLGEPEGSSNSWYLPSNAEQTRIHQNLLVRPTCVILVIWSHLGFQPSSFMIFLNMDSTSNQPYQFDWSNSSFHLCSVWASLLTPKSGPEADPTSPWCRIWCQGRCPPPHIWHLILVTASFHLPSVSQGLSSSHGHCFILPATSSCSARRYFSGFEFSPMAVWCFGSSSVSGKLKMNCTGPWVCLRLSWE